MSYNYDYNRWDNEEKFEKGVEFAKMFAPQQNQTSDQPVLKDGNLEGKKLAKPVQLSIFDLLGAKIHTNGNEQG